MKFMAKAILSCSLIWTLCTFLPTTQAFFIKRNVDLNVCAPSTPCGWEIYEVYTRAIVNFVRSPCDCGNGTLCMRWYDDLSKAAYVFRCAAVVTEETTATTARIS